MAGIKISQLSPIPSATLTDVAPFVQGGVTFKTTLLQIATLYGFSAGILGIAAGGTGVGTVTSAPTASAWAGWDANSNLSANNHIEGYTTTPTAAATTTLTVGSTYFQFFTGTTTQTVAMPVTSTLVLGQSYYIVNNSTGTVTVQSSGGNTIQAMAAGSSLLITCILTSGTTAASWSAQYFVNADLSGAVLLSPSGDQTITAHNLIVAGGKIQSGSGAGGQIGAIVLYPTTANNGNWTIQSGGNAGNFQVTYTIAAYGQASTVTFPDPGTASAAGVLAPSALVNGNLVKASGTLGLIVDAGVAFPTAGSPLPLNVGGTNASLTASNGGIFYSTGTAGAILAGTATANQVLLSGASTTPAWSTATYPPTTTINQLLYSSANNVIAGLATSTTAVLTTSSGVPTWAASLSLALGGLNNSNTASAGGIFWSDATKGNILAGTATAGLALLSGSSAAPTWSTKPPFTNVVVQTFAATGTYTPTAGMKFCLAYGMSGGGAGGSSQGGAAQVAAGGGGGSGVLGWAFLTAAQIGASKAVTIGAAGAPGAAGNNPGGNGGSTSLGTLLVCTGGQGGSGGATSAVVTIGGAGGGGGSVSTGDNVNATGANGFYGIAFGVTGAGVLAGQGASSVWGGGALPNAAGNNGGAATGYGGGGSGSGSTAADKQGGAGTIGYMIIYEFISV